MDSSLDLPAAQRAGKAPFGILCADDDEFMRQHLERTLANAGFITTTAADGNEAWKMLQVGTFDLLITDYQMPGLDGFELIREIRLARMTLPVILISGMLYALPVDELSRFNCQAVLPKPFTTGQLIDLVHAVLRANPGPNGARLSSSEAG